MDPGGPCCFCPPDKDFWEAMKNQFEDKTAVLMAKEQELRQKIEQMEALISGRESESTYSILQNRNIPKVFPDRPEYPVRDVPKIIREKSPPRSCSPCVLSPIKKEHCPPNFFQKVMENAKSILTLRCSAVHPSNPLDDKPTREKDEDLGDQKRDKSPFKVAFSSIVPVYTAQTVCTCDDELTKTDVTADNSQVNTSASCSLTCSCKNPTQSASTMTQSKKDNSSSVNSCGCGISNLTSSGPQEKNIADSICQCCNPECGTERDAGQNANLDNCWVNPFSCFQKKMQSAKNKKAVASSAKSCNNSTCPVVKSVKSAPDVNMNGKKNQANFSDDCSKRGRSQSKNKDEDNQCALVGSPVLEKGKAGEKKKCCCAANKSIFSIDSDDLDNVKMVAELATKEKQIKGQIQDLQERGKNYEGLVGNFQSVSNRTTCCCTIIQQQPGGGSDFDKISQELKLENKMLKSELTEMKLELKHCLEKIEGPMKQKLEAEQCKCMQLENKLTDASKNMVNNHDSHAKEVNALKMQLCVACNNIHELNSMNRRLKEEMNNLDCICNKLEDDLMKQKINEAETLKRLSRRKTDFDVDAVGGALQDSSGCDSNLNVIARKLSKTLKESEPCEECAKLPAELTGAAKCIKDLTDMVQKRKKEVDSFYDSKQDCCCQSPPPTEDESCQCCKACREVAAGESRVTTAIEGKAPECGARAAESTYYTPKQSEGDVVCSKKPCDDKDPCVDIGKPCVVEKGVQKEDGEPSKGAGKEMGEFCTEPCGDSAPCAHGKPCYEVIPSGELPAEGEGSVSSVQKQAADAAASATRTILEGVEDAQGEAGEKEPAAEGEAEDEEGIQGEEELISVSDMTEPPAEGVPEAGEGDGEVTAEGDAQEGGEAEAEGDEAAVKDRSAVETCRTCIEEGICKAFPKESAGGEEGDAEESTEAQGEAETALSEGLATEEGVASTEIPADTEEGALGESATEELGTMEAEGIAEEQESEGITPGADGEISTDQPGAPFEASEGETPDSAALMAGEIAGAAAAYPEGVVAGVPGMPGSSLPFKEERTGNFPFEVETRADVLQEPPSDLHVTTTITGSGTLEVITEGPGGVIETTLTYTADGTIEVVTQLTEDTARTVAPTVDYTSSAVSETLATEVPCVAVEAPVPCAAATPESITSGPTDLSGGLESVSEISRDTMMISSYISEADKIDAMADTDKITDTGVTETYPAETMEEEVAEIETAAEEIAIEEAPAEEVTVEEEVTAPEEVTVEEEVVILDEIPVEEFAVEEKVAVEEVAVEEEVVEEEVVEEVAVEEVVEEIPVEEAEVEVEEVEEEGEAVEEEVAVLAPIEEGEEGEEVAAEEEAPEEEVPEEEVPEEEVPEEEAPEEEAPEEEAPEEVPVEEEGAGEGVPEEAEEGEMAEQAVTAKMRDCACQSSPPVEQSCQCCECKNVGVTTSQDSETLTDENMVQAPESPVETIPEEAEAETDSEFVTVTEEGTQSAQEADFAEAANLEAEKIQGTTDEVSTIKEEESGSTKGEEKAEGDARRPSQCECDGFETAPDTETQEGKGETSEATTCECATESKGLCSTLITEENMEPCKDESVQCDCGGEVEVDDRSEGKLSSGSDTEYEVEEKASKIEEEKKSQASEVPESVSKVSDKSAELPPVGSSDSSKPRKKRSSKFDAIRCDCPGICQCVVCSPEAIAKRKALTGSSLPASGQAGKLCCCIPQSSPQFQPPVQMNQDPTRPPFQVTQAYVQSQMPVYPHPTGCQCVNCICNCTPGPQYSSAPNAQYNAAADPQFNRNRTSIEDVFRPQQDIPLDTQAPRFERGKHPPNCECVDCLCLPKIKRLAKIRETPIIRDEKQVYQVQTLKCACGRATGKKSSKIPIATNSPLGPPKAKGSTGGATCTCEKCSCSPCPDPSQGKSKPEDGAADKPGSESENKVKMTNSQLANLCDCQDCQCKVCFNKPPKKGEATDSKAPEPPKEQAKGTSNKGCCCKGECTCQPCPLDKGAQPTTPKPDGHPADCDCVECLCPRSPARMAQAASAGQAPPGATPAAAPKPGHPEGCNCEECLCPGSPSRMGQSPPAAGPGVTPQVSFAPGHPEGCDCTECSCPGLQAVMGQTDSKMQKTPSGQQKPSGCDCDVCTCPGMVSGKGDKSGAPPGCDCVVCDCPGGPGGGTKSTPGQPSAPAGSAPPASGIADCDCADCQCSPCADPKKRKPGTAAITPCDCADCKCAPCADPAKRGEGDVQLGHPEGCTCTECKCADEAEITKVAPLHPLNCTCGECKCPEDTGLQTEDRGVGSTENKATHPPDCICDECLCEGGEKHEAGCNCPECLCVDCYHKKEDKAISPDEECKCGDCLCVDCPKAHKTDGKGGKDAASGGAHGANCCCIECACDVCSDKTKGKSPGGDKGSACTCTTCTCVDCAAKKKEEITCKCGDCKCVDCPAKASSGAAAASGASDGDKGGTCTCSPCQCTDCPKKKTESGPTCNCGDCKCVDCPAKKGAGAPSASGGGAPSGSSDGDKGGMCSCGDCKCANCRYKSAKADSDKGGAGAPPSSGGAPASGSSDGDKGGICSCGDCKCEKCAYKSQKGGGAKEGAGGSPAAPGSSDGDKGGICSCGECKCEKCAYKSQKGGGAKEGAGGSAAAPGSSDGDKGNCTCSTCTCVDCAAKKKSGGPPPCNCGDCKCVDCAAKKGAGAPSGGGAPSAGASPTGDSKEKGAGCTCLTCLCIDCKKGKSGGAGAAGGAPGPNEICHCGNCKCPDCTYKKSQGAGGKSPAAGGKGGQPGEITLTDPPPFEVPKKDDCKCATCQCYICAGKGGTKQPASGSPPPPGSPPPKSGAQGKSGEVPLSTAEAPPFEVPMRLPCSCPKCDCATCNKNVATQPSSAGPPPSGGACQPQSQGKGGKGGKGGGEVSPATAEAPPFEVPVRLPCKCGKCDCATCNKTPPPQPASGGQPSRKSAGTPAIPCDCATCTCGDKGLQVDRSNAGKGEPKEQANVIDISRMGNAELMSKIKKDTKENCECREQIKELRRALDKIKCACTEAEIASQNKPFVKQASAFGQTMSGLKVALANLQDKCKAKDRMIEAMTDELKLRTSSNTLDKVINAHRGSEPLDYDKAEDVKVLDRVSTNVLYPATEEKEIGHTKVRPKSSECRAPCKGVGTDQSRKAKRKSKSHKDTSGVDLAGFEIVDIRRITQDSIIIKWKSPRSNVVTGYDIFVNGVNKSKVMSGGRTSAMIHSLDLSATVQITIYAVTKEGRCEPPAIAIYEIS